MTDEQFTAAAEDLIAHGKVTVCGHRFRFNGGHVLINNVFFVVDGSIESVSSAINRCLRGIARASLTPVSDRDIVQRALLSPTIATQP